ncbi:MAG: hypothetical protein QGG42_19295 [Phycisphaerae bacterium]|jgi:hypothetical protein|nr:hypothetical protein [Phycisphaerae bacterium]
MRDVFLRVMVVLALMQACIASAPGQAAAKRGASSPFDQLDNGKLVENLNRFTMLELVPLVSPDDKTPSGTLFQVRLQIKLMASINNPAECLKEGEKLIARLTKALDQAEKDLEIADEAAEKATGKLRTRKLLDAAKAAHLYYDIWFCLGNLSGNHAVRPYVRRIRNLQDNREDRKVVLRMTEDAARDLRDMQADLKDSLRDWQGNSAVWMIMGSRGERLLRDAKYWSTWTYVNRAMALGDAEAHESERAALNGAFQTASAKIAKDQAAERQKLKDKLAADLAKLSADQKRRTAQRRELLQLVLDSLPTFEKTKRFGVTHNARGLLAVAHRELGQYAEAIDKLAPQRYAKADGATKLQVYMDLPITLVKQGKYSDAVQAVNRFKVDAAKLWAGPGAKLDENQQAQVDLYSAVLEEYLARRWAATSTDPTEKKRHRAEGAAVLANLLDKHQDGSKFGQFFINYFGNRLVYVEDINQLNSVQLYIIARGAAVGKDHEKRKALLETFLGRKDDPAVKKLAPLAHRQLAMTLNKLGRQMDASDHFIAVVTLLGKDHPKSPTAAKNAAICMDLHSKWYQTSKKRALPRTVRSKFVTAMRWAVSFDTPKNAKLKLFEWYYDLGRHCTELAKSSPTPRERTLWMQRAGDAFSKVPKDPPAMYYSAQDLWLDMRYRALLTAARDAKLINDAVKLREDYAVFVQRLEKYIATFTDKESDEVKRLTRSAGWADFTRAKLLFEQLLKETPAMVEIGALLKKWSAVDDVVVAATQWKIQNLLNLGKIEDASAELQAFKKANEKRPILWMGLIRQMVGGIREAIDKARAEGGNKAKLASLRKSFLELVKIQYDPIKGKPIEGSDGKIDSERLAITRFWIDALVQNNSSAEALALATECRRIFQKRRAVKTGKIEKAYASVISQCQEAGNLDTVLEKLAAAFRKDLNKHANNPPGSTDFHPQDDAKAVDIAIKAMKDAIGNASSTPERRERAMAAAALEIETGYRETIRRLKNRIPIDLTVEWNVAKCLAATGKYGEALKIYSDLINKTDRLRDDNSKRRFWRLQLEYCQVFVKGRSKNAKQMAMLANHIEKNLEKIEEGALGGFQQQFYAIRKEARRNSQQKP